MGGFKFGIEGTKYIKLEEKTTCMFRTEISLECLGENVAEEKGRGQACRSL